MSCVQLTTQRGTRVASSAKLVRIDSNLHLYVVILFSVDSTSTGSLNLHNQMILTTKHLKSLELFPYQSIMWKFFASVLAHVEIFLFVTLCQFEDFITDTE